MILFEKKYQTFDTVFHHQMKHLEVRQKYFAARRIFNSLLGVSSGDETLRLMFDILLDGFSLTCTCQTLKKNMEGSIVIYILLVQHSTRMRTYHPLGTLISLILS